LGRDETTPPSTGTETETRIAARGRAATRSAPQRPGAPVAVLCLSKGKARGRQRRPGPGTLPARSTRTRVQRYLSHPFHWLEVLHAPSGPANPGAPTATARNAAAALHSLRVETAGPSSQSRRPCCGRTYRNPGRPPRRALVLWTT
jgi:hypothetical protein